MKPAFLQEDLTPTKAFERFFDEHVIVHVVENHTFSTSASETKAFLANVFISGYSTVPHRPMHLEPADDVYNAAVAMAMARNSFDSIIQFLHVADNDHVLRNYRMAKERPF